MAASIGEQACAYIGHSTRSIKDSKVRIHQDRGTRPGQETAPPPASGRRRRGAGRRLAAANAAAEQQEHEPAAATARPARRPCRAEPESLRARTVRRGSPPAAG